MQRKYTLSQASQILGVARTTVTRAAQQGLLTPIHGGILGNRIIGVSKDSVDALLSRRNASEAQSAKEGR